MNFDAVLVTCEHASRRVPRELARAVSTPSRRRLLATHQSYDMGAARVARALVDRLRALGVAVAGPVLGEVTRLLVDLNRSPQHPHVFGVFGRGLCPAQREALMLRYYLPHQRRVRHELLQLLEQHGRVLHLGVHSFTPVLRGQRRDADVGVLYDPGRGAELEFARRLSRVFADVDEAIRVRRNYPYRGTSDGLTTMLRQESPAARYAGVELELNQRHLGRARSVLERAVVVAVGQVLTAATS
jgi:predicted N-formylglutamate amidohydrolase